MMPLWLFIFLGVLVVLSAFGTVLQRNPIHCLLSLVVTLLVIGIFYIALDAPTVGLLQIIVYAGAIMVLFLFVIWLLNLQVEVRTAPGHLALKAFGAVFCAALVAELFTIGWQAPSAAGAKLAVPAGYGSIHLLATTLFSDYLIAFEVTSVLLLAAVVGAVALARRLPPVQARASAARGTGQMQQGDGGPGDAVAARGGARSQALVNAAGDGSPANSAHGAGYPGGDEPARPEGAR